MRNLLAAALIGAATPALAAPAADAPVPPNERDSLQIGVGLGVSPDYTGSNDYRLIPAATLRARVSGVTIQTEGLRVTADLVDLPGRVDLDAGPVVGVNLDRTRRVHDPVVRLLPERNVAVEVGGFAGFSLKQITNPYDRLGVRITAVKDVASAHQSLVLTPSVSYMTPLSPAILANLSVSGDIVTDRYAYYYFGVSPADSLASGLRTFSPKGGLKNVRGTLVLGYKLDGDMRKSGWGLFGIASYSRLRGDFKRSPLVADRGSAGQWLGAAGIGYSW